MPSPTDSLGVIVKCPSCYKDFELCHRHFSGFKKEFLVEEAKEEKNRLLRSQQRENRANKPRIVALLKRAADDRTPIPERIVAVEILEKEFKLHKVKLGQGIDEQILQFQFFRGWLQGFRQYQRPRIEGIKSDKSKRAESNIERLKKMNRSSAYGTFSKDGER